MRAVVLSDTHLRPGRARRLSDAALAELAAADVILHAGDVVSGDLLAELATIAPTHAVLGNNDLDLAGELPEELELELEGVRIAMVHDSGPAQGRERRMATRFPAADLVVFGHSHIPWNAPGEGTQWLLNPGSPTERRRQPAHTLGVVEVADGRIVRTAIVEV